MSYSKSTFSFFASYSGKDNEASSERLGTFIDKLSSNLRYGLDYEQDNDIENKNHVDYRKRPKIMDGGLERQLEERIKDSFIYIAFAGKGFLCSDYCNMELDFVLNNLQNKEICKPCYFIALDKNAYDHLQEKFGEMCLPDLMILKLYKDENHNGMPMDDIDSEFCTNIIIDIRMSMVEKIIKNITLQKIIKQEKLLQTAEETYGKPNTDKNVINIFINENENDRIDIKNYLDAFKNENFPEQKSMRIFPMPLDDIDEKQLALINKYADGVILSGRGAENDEIRKNILDQKIYQIMTSTMTNKSDPVSGMVLLKSSSKAQANEGQPIKTLWQVFKYIFDPPELSHGEFMPREVKPLINEKDSIIPFFRNIFINKGVISQS